MRATGAVLAVLAVLAAGGLATACARGASGTPNAAPSGSYLDCLREHGVNLPQGVASGRSRPSGFGPSGLGPSGIRPSGVVRSGGSGAGGFFGTQAPAGVDQSTWEKALQACACPARSTSLTSAIQRGRPRCRPARRYALQILKRWVDRCLVGVSP